MYRKEINEENFEKAEDVSSQDFDKIYKYFYNHIYNTALGILKNREDAKEVTQEVFIEIYENFDDFDPDRGTLKTWLTIKTKSRSYDFLRTRKQKHKPLKYNDPRLCQELLENIIIKNFQQKKIQKILDKISPKQGNLIKEKYLKQKTHKELSEEYQLPLGSVKSAIRYGLKKVIKKLDE